MSAKTGPLDALWLIDQHIRAIAEKREFYRRNFPHWKPLEHELDVDLLLGECKRQREKLIEASMIIREQAEALHGHVIYLPAERWLEEHKEML